MANKRAKEPTTAINITLPVSAAQNLDKNIDRLRIALVGAGAKREDVEKTISRSYVVREVVKSLGTEAGFHAFMVGICAVVGVDQGQQDLFKDKT